MDQRVVRHAWAMLLVAVVVATAVLRPPAAVGQGGSLLSFVEVTEEAGLSYDGETWGWAWGDYDKDGHIDVFLGHHPELNEPLDQRERPSALMRNNGNGTFTDVIGSSGIALYEDRHDHAWVDYDNDGDLDLWITVGADGGVGDGPKELWQNDGNGYFVNVAEEAGLLYPLNRGRGSVWFDFDLDGDLDMFITGAKRDEAGNAFFRNNNNGTFTNISGEVGVDPFTGQNPNAAVGDFNGDGYPDLYVTGTSPKLYLNDGGVRFIDVTSSAGLTGGSVTAVAWGDYNNNGLLDLFVSRGAHDLQRDYYESTDRTITFLGRTLSGDEDGLDFSTASGDSVTFNLQLRHGNVYRSPDVVYLGPDGRHPSSMPFTLSSSDVSGPPPYTPGSSLGIYIWQQPAGSWHIRWTTHDGTLAQTSGTMTATTSISSITPVLWEPLQLLELPNKLYRNNGNGTFTDVAAAAGLADPQDTRAAAWGDFDNDGYLDLFVQSAGSLSGNAPNRLYRNNGDGTFTDIAAQVGVQGTDQGYGWGGLLVDYNNSGFLDLFTSQESWTWPFSRGGYQLFRNQGNSNRWVQIGLRGNPSNTHGLDARVRLTACGQTQYRWTSDNSYYSHHYLGPVQFGLGSCSTIDSVEVRWPSGRVQTVGNIPVDQHVTIHEGESNVTPTPEPPTATPTATLTPGASVEIIVDNLDPTFGTVGTWQSSSDQSLLPYGSDFVYTRSGTGSSTATFGLSVSYEGEYEVFAWWAKCWVCATDTPYTIHHANGSTTVRVNQSDQSLAGQWNSLGTFTFRGGSSIVVANNANNRVQADAVRIVIGSPSTPTPIPPTSTPTPDAPTLTPTPDVPTPTPTQTQTPTITPTPGAVVEVIVDNRDTGFSTVGNWQSASQSSLLHYGDDFVYTRSGTGASTATFSLGIAYDGTYEVFAWWPNCWVCATNTPYTIHHAGGSTIVTVNQNDRTIAGRWNSLGVFTFQAGSGGIVVSDNANARVQADAVRALRQ